MNKKTIALLVSTTLTFNSMQLALAQQSVSSVDALLAQAHKNVSANDLLALGEMADQKTVEELKVMLAQVNDLAVKLKSVSVNNSQDLFLQNANKIQIVLAALSSYIMHSHYKGKEQTTILLSLATASSLLNTVVRHYKADKNLSAGQLSEMVFEVSQDMSKDKNITPELAEITNSLNQVSRAMLESQSKVEDLVKTLGGGQDWLVLANVAFLVAHIVSPKTAIQVEAVAKEVLPKLKQLSVSAQQVAQKVAQSNQVRLGANGATGISGIGDILSMTAGLSSDESVKLIAKTLIDLDTTSKKISAQINTMEKAK